MAEELKKEQDSSTMLERMKKNMESTVKGCTVQKQHTYWYMIMNNERVHPLFLRTNELLNLILTVSVCPRQSCRSNWMRQSRWH